LRDWWLGETDRDDATAKGRRTVLRNEVREAQHRNGALLIPSFAVERAQELISDLVQLMSQSDDRFLGAPSLADG
jgi:metallo-beta-lactamase family protein